MNTSKEIPPVSNQGTSQAVGTNESTNFSIQPKTQEELTDFICQNTLAHRVYLMGYEAGVALGARAALMETEKRAELAAHRFYAMEQYDVDNRRAARSAAEFIDVAKARAEQRGAA